jgi:tetratricopeptide (TPR) repeat protein
MGGRDDWFRRTTWTSDDRAEFAARLGRSRTIFHKAQYLRIQAVHLAAAEPPLHEAALELLDQLLRDFADPFEVPQARTQRARSLAAVERRDEAIEEYRRALADELSVRTVRGLAYIEFAELVLEDKRREFYVEALVGITARTDRGAEAFPASRYRAETAAAFLSEELGDYDAARAHATIALAAAAETQSPFRYHRDLGVVRSPAAEVQARLWRLAGRSR